MQFLCVCLKAGQGLRAIDKPLATTNFLLRDDFCCCTKVRLSGSHSPVLLVFSKTVPPQWVDCLALIYVYHIEMEASRKMSYLRTQQKQTCRLVLHTVLLVLSAKQGSCEYYFVKSFGMIRLEK